MLLSGISVKPEGLRGIFMKYTTTSRTISLIAHAAIILGFGFLAVLFGFFVAPEFLGSNADLFYKDVPGWNFNVDGAYFLWFELAVVGIVFTVISALGLYQAIKAIQNPRDDEPAVRSFSALICEGWLAAIFFFFQGALLWNLTANGNIVFVVVAAILIAIVLLIATNIPMVKIFDQRDQTPLLRDFIGCGALVTGAMAIEGVASLFYAMVNNSGVRGQIYYFLYIIIIASALAFVLALLGWLFLGKHKDSKGLKISSFLAAGAIAISGVGLIAYAIMDINYGTAKTDIAVHLYSKLNSGFDLGFGIMGIVIGALMIIGALVMALVANNDVIKSKKQ